MGKKISREDMPPQISISEDNFVYAGFTSAGVQRYKQTICSYSDQLFKKSILLGEFDKVDNYDREITEKHVRKATEQMTTDLSRGKSNSFIFFQVLEYVCTGIVGAGASNLGNTWGIVLFVLGLVFGIVFFVFRNIKTR